MREYIAFLNELSKRGKVDFEAIDEFWIERVHEFFAGKPFKMKVDASRSLRTAVGDLVGERRP